MNGRWVGVLLAAFLLVAALGGVESLKSLVGNLPAVRYSWRV